jgi:hypothetical protein
MTQAENREPHPAPRSAHDERSEHRRREHHQLILEAAESVRRTVEGQRT